MPEINVTLIKIIISIVNKIKYKLQSQDRYTIIGESCGISSDLLHHMGVYLVEYKGMCDIISRCLESKPSILNMDTTFENRTFGLI